MTNDNQIKFSLSSLVSKKLVADRSDIKVNMQCNHLMNKVHQIFSKLITALSLYSIHRTLVQKWQLCKLLFVALVCSNGMWHTKHILSCYLQCRKVEDKKIMTQYIYLFVCSTLLPMRPTYILHRSYQLTHHCHKKY